MNTFNHPFKAPISDKEAQQIFGYTKALHGLQKKLEELTEWNPNKRMIDALVLLEAITDTNEELGVLLAEFEERLKNEPEIAL